VQKGPFLISANIRASTILAFLESVNAAVMEECKRIDRCTLRMLLPLLLLELSGRGSEQY
jgi:hypothetical protein